MALGVQWKCQCRNGFVESIFRCGVTSTVIMKVSTSVLSVLSVAGMAAGSPAGVLPGVERRSTSTTSPSETFKRIVRGLDAVRLKSRDTSFTSNTTVLDTSWTEATLLKQGLYDAIPSHPIPHR